MPFHKISIFVLLFLFIHSLTISFIQFISVINIQKENCILYQKKYVKRDLNKKIHIKGMKKTTFIFRLKMILYNN